MNQKNEVWPNGMPEVGQMAQRSREVAARDIEFFTEISGDRNPLHYDEEAARAYPFWRHCRSGRCHQRNPERGRGRRPTGSGHCVPANKLELQSASQARRHHHR